MDRDDDFKKVHFEGGEDKTATDNTPAEETTKES